LTEASTSLLHIIVTLDRKLGLHAQTLHWCTRRAILMLHLQWCWW
jgi:hypothetical protein